MKKLTCIALTIVIILSANLASANDYLAIKKIETSGDKFTVIGENISKVDSVVTFQVLKNGASWEELTTFDYVTCDITNILATFDTISNISYGQEFRFSAKTIDGNIPKFRIRFGDSDIASYDPVFIDAINNAQTALEIKQLITGNSIVWNEISSEVVKLTLSQQDAFWQRIFATKDALKTAGHAFALPSEIVSITANVAVLAQLDCVETYDELKTLIDLLRSKNIISGNSYDIYAGKGAFDGYGMSNSQKTGFFAYICENISHYDFLDEFLNAFNENALLFAIEGSSKSAIDLILKKSDLIDSKKIPLYTKLSNAKNKANVCEKVGVSRRYGSIDELLKAVESYALTELKNKDDNSQAGGSLGGGGGKNVEFSMPTVAGKQSDENNNLPFDDLTDVEWAKDAIIKLSEKGIVVGYGNGKFNPNKNVNRNEFVKMLVVALEIKSNNSIANFEDVSTSDWSYPYICAACGCGIINGLTTNTFGNGRLITREEMVTIAYRAVVHLKKTLPNNDKGSFNDSSLISPWAIDSCLAMYNANIINGMGNNCFCPKEYVTRAQAAKIIYELMNL